MSIGFFSEEVDEIKTLSNYDGSCYRTSEFGTYWISHEVLHSYENNRLSAKSKFLCIQETIRLNRQGQIPFWISQSVTNNDSIDNPIIVFRSIEEVSRTQTNHQEKNSLLIASLSEKIKDSINPFEFTHLNKADRYFLGIFNDEEYITRINYLITKKLIELELSVQSMWNNKIPQYLNLILTTDVIKITIEGWEYLNNVIDPKRSKNVFIAMAFTDNDGKRLSYELRDTLKSSLEEIGWTPIIVDEIQHNDGVMDKVVSSIKSSRFIIAELSYQKTGVYYEAGYGKGLGLQVIHLVKKEDLSKCHFDVKHLNLIIWEDLKDLQVRLQTRIKATVDNNIN